MVSQMSCHVLLDWSTMIQSAPVLGLPRTPEKTALSPRKVNLEIEHWGKASSIPVTYTVICRKFIQSFWKGRKKKPTEIGRLVSIGGVFSTKYHKVHGQYGLKVWYLENFMHRKRPELIQLLNWSVPIRRVGNKKGNVLVGVHTFMSWKELRKQIQEFSTQRKNAPESFKRFGPRKKYTPGIEPGISCFIPRYPILWGVFILTYFPQSVPVWAMVSGIPRAYTYQIGMSLR